MQTRSWLLMLGLSASLVTALSCVGYLFSGGAAPVLAFAICALALLVGQTLLASYLLLQSQWAETTARQFTQKLGYFNARQEEAQGRMGLAFSEIAEIKSHDKSRNSVMAQSLGELKTSYQALAKSLQNQVSETRSSPKTTEPPPMPVVASIIEPEDDLAISLEPIVDLSSGRTAHYRVHLSLAAAQDNQIEQVRLLHFVDSSGKRPEFDLHAIKETLKLLERLHDRDAEIRLFITIGSETLSDAAAMLQILETLQSSAEHGSKLVFELPHIMLAGLSSAALEGLGSLARFGQPLALAKVSISGLDPQALQGLNVRFVSVDANSIDLRSGVPVSYHHFTQLARLAKITTLLANVTDAHILPQCKLISRFGSGPVFATPRRVRRGTAAGDVSLAA